VSTAEAYFESALTQARDAGLDEAATEEYLAEQQAAAAKLLRRAPLGQYMHSLARTVGLGHRLDAEPGVPDNAEHRQALAQCIVRERMLVGDAADDAMPDPLTEADAYLAKAAMRLTHLEKKVTHDGGVLLDVVPTQCIVRIKNSGRRKQTAFVTSQKAAVSFKTNFAAFLKKDVAPLLKYFKDDAVSDDKKAKKNNATPPPKSGGAGGKKK
jgi:hypothetical protein